MKWILLAFGALIAWIIYNDNSGDGNDGISIPSLVAPVATDNACTSKTDAQGNWYGVNYSGNCTINALGGSSGSWD